MVWLVWCLLGEGCLVFLVILLPRDFRVSVLQKVVVNGFGFGFVDFITPGVVVGVSVSRG